jgi:hypothetical protein
MSYYFELLQFFSKYAIYKSALHIPKGVDRGISEIILVWSPGQNKRIAPLSFLHGCRKWRLKV